MARYLRTLFVGLGAVMVLTAAAQLPPTFAEAQPGVWEISGAPGAKAPMRQCIGDLTTLTRFEHRSKRCSVKVLKNAGSNTQVEYSCRGAGFGHSDIQVLTPRSLKISTQGISDGLPFNYVLQARRIEDCPKAGNAAHH